MEQQGQAELTQLRPCPSGPTAATPRSWRGACHHDGDERPLPCEWCSTPPLQAWPSRRCGLRMYEDYFVRSFVPFSSGFTVRPGGWTLETGRRGVPKALRTAAGLHWTARAPKALRTAAGLHWTDAAAGCSHHWTRLDSASPATIRSVVDRAMCTVRRRLVAVPPPPLRPGLSQEWQSAPRKLQRKRQTKGQRSRLRILFHRDGGGRTAWLHLGGLGC